MFWLVHLYDNNAFNEILFASRYDTSNSIGFAGKPFFVMIWYGRGKQHIEKWKRLHVRFSLTTADRFFPGNMLSCSEIAGSLGKG